MKNLFKKMLIVATLLAINSANLFAQEIVTVTNEKGGKLVKTISKQLKVSKSAITIEKLTHLSINGILWGNDLVELSKAAPSLEYLEIVENKIWDHFKGVINMPIMSNLKELRLPSNVEEISIKSSLPKLEYLEISSYHTAIKDQQQFIPYLYLRSYKDKAIDYKTATRISSSSPIVTGGDRIGVYLTGANDKNDYFMNANAVYDLAQKETKLLKWQNHFTPEVLLEVDDIYHYEFGSRFKYDNIFLFKNIGDGTFIVPIGVKSLPAECFTGSLYNKIIINADVPSIPEGCFSNCKNLKSVELNGNIKTIGRNAFKGCGLSEITLPETINEIDIEAFEGSEIKRVSLLSTTLPKRTRADRYSTSQIPKYIIFDISKEAYISLPNDSYWKNYKFEIRGEKKRVDIV